MVSPLTPLPPILQIAQQRRLGAQQGTAPGQQGTTSQFGQSSQGFTPDLGGNIGPPGAALPGFLGRANLPLLQVGLGLIDPQLGQQVGNLVTAQRQAQKDAFTFGLAREKMGLALREEQTERAQLSRERAAINETMEQIEESELPENTKMALRFSAAAGDVPQFTETLQSVANRAEFSPVRDSNKNIVGQKNSLTGEVTPSPRANIRLQQQGQALTRRGQDVTLRGQDLSAEASALSRDLTQRGQDITQRGQDIASTDRALSRELQTAGQALTKRGQDLSQSTAIRGQDLTADSQRLGRKLQQQGLGLQQQGQKLRDRLAKMGDATTRRGQDLRDEAAALSRELTESGQTLTQRGQDLSASTTRRGQDLTATAAEAKRREGPLFRQKAAAIKEANPNLTDDEATNFALGITTLSESPLGDRVIVNKADGTGRLVQIPVELPEQISLTPQADSLIENTELVYGPEAMVRAGAGRVLSNIKGLENVGQRQIEKRTLAKSLRNEIQSALRTSNRRLAIEFQEIAEIIPNEDAFIAQSPAAGRTQLAEVYRLLEENAANDFLLSKSNALSIKARQEHLSRGIEIRRVMAKIGNPGGQAIDTQQELDAVQREIDELDAIIGGQ